MESIGKEKNSSDLMSLDQDTKEPLLSTRDKLEITEDLEAQKLQASRQSLIGYSLFFLFVLINSLGDSVSKILYLNHANLSVFEMLFMRGVIFIFVLLYLMGSNLKNLMWDSIPREMFLPLAIRSSCGLLAFFCMNYAIKFLPIVLVSLFANTLPLFTSLLGFIILGERISKIEIACLVLAFYGVYVLLYSDTSSEGMHSNVSLLPILALLFGPILSSIVNIALRHMRKLHEYTSSMYSVLLSITVFGLLMPITNQPITMFDSFKVNEYFILVFVAMAGGTGMLMKTKSFQYEMAGRLSILAYLSVVFTFFFDFFFIGTTFTAGEIRGIIIVFLANAISAYVVYKKNFSNQ